jgi:hypothetical protein
MTLDLAEWKRLAQAATPGPWEAYNAAAPPDSAWGVGTAGAMMDGYKRSIIEADFVSGRDAAYIAHSSPDRVQALIEQVKAAQRENGGLVNGQQTLVEVLQAAEVEVTALTAQVETLKTDRELLDLLTSGKSPCGHWSAYAHTEDGGKQIVCLQCQVETLTRDLQEAKAEIVHVTEMHVTPGKAAAQFAGIGVEAFALLIAEFFVQAKGTNYADVTGTFTTPEFVLTCQKRTGKTPDELMREERQRADAAEAKVETLTREANVAKQITFCENCGANWCDDGNNLTECPYCLITTLTRERDEARREISESWWELGHSMSDSFSRLPDAIKVAAARVKAAEEHQNVADHNGGFELGRRHGELLAKLVSKSRDRYKARAEALEAENAQLRAALTDKA